MRKKPLGIMEKVVGGILTFIMLAGLIADLGGTSLRQWIKMEKLRAALDSFRDGFRFLGESLGMDSFTSRALGGLVFLSLLLFLLRLFRSSLSSKKSSDPVPGSPSQTKTVPDPLPRQKQEKTSPSKN